MPFFQTVLLISAVSALAIADVILKKAQATGSIIKAITSPWMLGVIILYLFQIFIFTYLFVSGAKLIPVGIIQTVLYAIIILLAGIFIYGETLSGIQMAGVILSLLGVFLLNF
jgi:drug/metabolite transporter (DMT)-like permease